ncbi:MAG: hypothetical protein Q7T42_08360 [Methylotenera sp.]|jgi:hypothetical protein|uniref:hypothetical protein n=1 Tax=Methylotenera sp. TaxID=2051956 RepID=UPI002724585C|nr:hypothetical protein [Methylotenera sp.]MDO9203950.1 hypothetical protein [Methylotenera sp.]MDO9393967.1 hypothetical protein [Methylotenera sp.]MDP1522421.1 hypothetical protein [Methylotenera sp.]MDP2229520.1 hypothetical protein [Methylotenera sp.]MDP3140936.1 hypothetical protein [Methylotenera sp.]
MKIRVVLLLCLSLFLQTVFAGVTVATPAVTGPKVKITMRDNGYTLGDTIAMHAEFNLAKGLVFDPNSVPLKGPVNNWLDLRNVSMAEAKNADGGRKISIDFTWQIFGTVEHAQTLKIPAIQLQTIPSSDSAKADDNAKDSTAKLAANKPLTITIPAQGFNLSPVLPPTITENTHRPHAPPLRFNERTPLMVAIICLILGLLCGALWLWLQDKISWLPRNPGPMTQLARQLKQQKLSQQNIGQVFTVENLRTIHAGLASSAGQSLYPNTLVNLFEKSPYLAAEKPAITQFFNASWQTFYEKNTHSSTSNISVTDTLRWINRSALAERLSRRPVSRRLVSPRQVSHSQANQNVRQKPVALNRATKA